MKLQDYGNNSSLKVRGGDVSQLHPIATALQELIVAEQNITTRPPVNRFNHCGMAFAYHSPDIQGILLGTSKIEQLKDSIAFYNNLQQYDYSGLYEKLLAIQGA